MRHKGFSILTAVTTALSAAALFILPYEFGLFPGGFLEDAAVGPVPLWALCSALVVLLATVCIGTLVQPGGRERRHQPVERTTTRSESF